MRSRTNSLYIGTSDVSSDVRRRTGPADGSAFPPARILASAAEAAINFGACDLRRPRGRTTKLRPLRRRAVGALTLVGASCSLHTGIKVATPHSLQRTFRLPPSPFPGAQGRRAAPSRQAPAQGPRKPHPGVVTAPCWGPTWGSAFSAAAGGLAVRTGSARGGAARGGVSSP